MVTVSTNIKHLLHRFGVSNASIAKIIGVDKSTLTRWFSSDSSPRSESVKAIADYFGIPVSLLYESPDEFEKSLDELKGQPTVYEVAAGQGRINETPETFEPSSGRCARVVGDSMYPTLHNGDYVRIVETMDVSPTDYAVVRINGDEVTIKHVEFTDDGMWVRGENKEVFEDKFYSIKDIVLLPVQVVGKAVEIIQRKL